MAESYVIDVQDSASVDSWKSEVQALNEKTAQVVKEAANALAEFKDTAEGYDGTAQRCDKAGGHRQESRQGPSVWCCHRRR